MSKRPDDRYFLEGNPENYKKQCTMAFINTSQEPMVGPVVDDEAVIPPTQICLVHNHPNLSVPQIFNSPDGFMEDETVSKVHGRTMVHKTRVAAFRDPGRMTSHGSTTTRPRIVPFTPGTIGACRK